MAGVYTRDNINYSSMLQNAIANRNAAAQREAAYEQAKGKLWGDTVNNITKYAGRGIMASADQYSTDEDEAELERLKALKAKEDEEALIKQQQSEWAANQMQGYKPLVQMNDYKPYESELQQMNESYDNKYVNPYTYAMMQGVYRRGR